MSDLKTLTQNHDYKLEFIRPATGASFCPPWVSGWYVNALGAVGEAEIILPNDWVKDRESGLQKLPRNEIQKLDIIQIWRDMELIWSGRVLAFKRSFSTLTFKCKSEAWLLTKQYTAKETYTEEPATTVKRYLKGWEHYLSDYFNRAAIGDNYTYESPWTIDNNALYANGIETAKNCEYNTPQVSWDNLKIEFDLTLNQNASTDAAYCAIKWAYAAANDYFYVAFAARDTGLWAQRVELGHVLDYSTQSFNWWGNNAHKYRIKILVATSGGDVTTQLYMDDLLIKSDTVTATPSAGTIRFTYGGEHANNYARIDNLVFRHQKQLLSEGTINNVGSSKTTTVSYETLFNAIDKRICPQCASSDDLAPHWEWKENPIAFVDAATPCASLDFKERIGANKDIVLSIEEKNLKAFESEENWEEFATDVIALGAGTAETEAAGQNMYRASDFDAYDDAGLILEELYQLSEEQNYDNLATLATLWLGKRTQFHENIRVDPIDYEKHGFQIGDGYLLDIEQLKISPDGYYRIMSERRDFTAEGAESITVNWKDKQRSFLEAIRSELRQLKNVARYGQGNYTTYCLPKNIENSVAAQANSATRHLPLNADLFLSVKRVNFSNDSDSTAWKLFIDDVDRTSDIWGTGTVSGNVADVDVTQFVSSVGESHTFYCHNDDSTSRWFTTWVDALLYVR